MLWILVIFITLFILYKKLTLPHSHWQKLGVKCWKPVIFFGDLWNPTIGRESYADMIKRQYDDFKSERFYGGYNMMTPGIYIKDPELLRQIAIKDFDYFTDKILISAGGPLWLKSLPSLRGERWYQMRCTLTPTFTSSKMKAMFDFIDECANKLVVYFVNSNLQLQEIEMHDVSTRYANDVIATCAFGINCDSLAEKNNQFYMSGRQLTNISGYYVSILMALFSAFPGVLNLLGVNLKPKETHDYFKNCISKTIKFREENNIVRKDMLQILMEARKVSLVDGANISLEDVQAQALAFFFGGVSTISRLISFTAHELAINPGIQRCLLKEIDDTIKDGRLSYEALNSMKYLDMVVAESLRLWPPAPVTNRTCTAPYKLETSPHEPQLSFKKGDQIYIPIFALHRDPEHFPDPEKFDPERFSEENKSKIKPYTYIPFGIGPRNCIASRFALMEAKVALVRLLAKFELVSTSKTQIPLKLDRSSRHPIAEHGFWMGLKLRSNKMLLWILVICIILYYYYKKVSLVYSYWQNLGVKCWKPVFLFGDHWWTSIGRECFAELQQRQYRDFPEERFYGGYQMTKPQLFIRDPELLREIAVKDFDHFTDHVYGGPPKSLWGRILFNLTGEEWRQMRYTLSPTFTSRKIKYMFELVDECAIRFVTYFEKKTEKVQEIEIKDAFKRYTNDVIATCAFGVECNSLVERENEFYVNGIALSDNLGVSRAIKRALYSFCPQLMQVPIIGLRSVYSTEFFKTLMADTVELRKASKVKRPDMLNLLMERNVNFDESEASNKDTGYATVEEAILSNNDKRKEITLEDIQGQSLNFFIAGFETSAVLLSFAGYEMAINDGVQTRLKEEIDRTMFKYNGKLTYEALNSMTYLDMIVSEALRKWPPVPATSRACTKPYNLQNGPTKLPLNKGDTIMFPIFAIQRDEKYFPKPEKFDPERFSVENRDKINPYTYIPFGIGPRNCIASRFALVEAKVILVRLLSKFELVPINKTEIPLILDKTNPFMGAANGIWVGLKRRLE